MEEKTMSWPGLDAALNELGMLSTVTSSRKEYLREKLEHQRYAHHVAGGSPPLSRSVERPLQPSQAWNMLGITGSFDGMAWPGRSSILSDNENNENTYDSSSSRLKAPLRIVALNPHHISSLGLDLSEVGYRRSCPARLAQLSTVSHRQHHLKPYNIPWRREERVRTKSENADSDTQGPEVCDIPSRDLESSLLTPPAIVPLFRSRSLEDVRSLSDNVEELDEMSREIQRLHVNE